jgi:hypothetical protein
VNPWLETFGVILVALTGVAAGYMFSRLKSFFWISCYFLSAAIIIMMVLARYSDALKFEPPFCWVAIGRIKFVILALAVTLGLTACLRHLPHKLEKVLVCILMSLVVVWFTVLPFLVPAVIKDHLANLSTFIDAKGVCIQGTNYTCGPAAAVTALGKLNLRGYEGELAILAHTSPVAGTLPSCLSDALESKYGSMGLKCRYRHFDAVSELKNSDVTLAVVKSAFMVDHCVVILDVSNNQVTIADPVLGEITMPEKLFEKIWQFSGIVLSRNQKT